MPKKRIKTKICANCAHEFKEIDNFCPNCGQENHHYNQSFGHLFMELIEAELHFDNKFWLTAKSLFARPGEITNHFIADMRARYVPPIRLYVFASAIFFLLSAWLGGGGKLHSISKTDKANAHTTTVKMSDAGPEFTVKETETAEEEPHTGGAVNEFVRGFSDEMSRAKKDSTLHVQMGSEEMDINTDLTTEQLDSIGHLSFGKRLVANFAKILKSETELATFKTHFLHLFGESIFICMPIAAFLLFLLYYRRKRNYYEFLIFSIYFHSFVFILMIFNKIMSKFIALFTTIDIFTDLLWFGIFVYFVLSLKRVYAQTWRKTILKAFIFTLLYAFVFVFVILGIMLYLFGFSAGH